MSKREFKVVMTRSGLDYSLFPTDIVEEILTRVNAKLQSYDCKSEDEIIRVSRDADALITDESPITRNVIFSLESLRGIVEAGVGYDTIDVEAATERGIPVCNTPDYITSEVTDHALSLILSLHRKVCRISRSTRTGTWNWLEATPIKGFSELTVGIIGLGRIGRQVTERLKAFGPKILFFDPYVTVEKINEVGASRTDLEALLKESDIVTIHCLLTNETKHLIGERELRLMKESAVLVNVSRGAIIDQEALYKALKESWIAAAGLDVLEKEPPNPDDPLLKLDNVIVTPHIAWYSEQSTKLLRRLPAEEVVRILRNERPKHIVNPEVLK